MSEAPKKISKSFPHACPVCKGRGELSEDLAQYEGVVKYELVDRKIYSCHVCQGQCLIWEYRDEDAPEEPSKLHFPQLQPGIFQPIGQMPFNQPLIIDNPAPLVPEQPWNTTVTWGDAAPQAWTNKNGKE